MTTPDDISLSEIPEKPMMIRTGEEPRRVRYVCRNCGAEDFDKLFHNEPVAPAINCWSCRAGRGLPMAAMIQSGNGMFPEPEKVEVPS